MQPSAADERGKRSNVNEPLWALKQYPSEIFKNLRRYSNSNQIYWKGRFLMATDRARSASGCRASRLGMEHFKVLHGLGDYQI